MKTAILTRQLTSDEGTFGILVCDNFQCATLELPWRRNLRGKSCVPSGSYLFKWRTDSPAHGSVYEEWDDPMTPQREDVKDRDNIQIHAANLAGDVDRGFVKQLDGCIALGLGMTTFEAGSPPAGSLSQRGITGSKITTQNFNTHMNRETFRLEIAWAVGVGPGEIA